MKYGIFAALGILTLSVLPAATAPAAPHGIWLSQDGDLKISLAACGNNRLCGTVVWLDEPVDPATGRPKTDKNNPDPAKRARPLVGLTVAHGLKPTGPNQWSGQVYNADDGRTYRARLEVRDAGTLRVEGCVLGVLCKSLTWTRS